MGTLVDVMKGLPFFACLGGVDDSEIATAEEALQVSFAEEYRDYLADFGVASANGHELTGICSSERLNVVDVTQDERGRGHNDESGWYVVERLGFDDLVAWQSPSGEVFLTAGGTEPRKVADSLIEYLDQ